MCLCTRERERRERERERDIHIHFPFSALHSPSPPPSPLSRTGDQIDLTTDEELATALHHSMHSSRPRTVPAGHDPPGPVGGHAVGEQEPTLRLLLSVNVNVSSTGPFSAGCQGMSAGMGTAGSGGSGGAAASSWMNGTSGGMYDINSGSGGMVGGVSGGNVPFSMSG